MTLADALRASKRASQLFESFSPSCKREYLAWVTTAERAGTRERRVAEAVQRIAAGRAFNEAYR